MKKQLLFLSIAMLSMVAFAQNSNNEFKPSGSPSFKVFTNFHTDMSSNATQKTAFALDRAYFGYGYKFSENISAKVTFDVGSNSGGSAYTAYLKAAQLDWKVANGVKLSMGLIGMKAFNDQEDFWGKRYLFKSFQDQNGFATSADLGLNAEFTLTKNLKANFIIHNGEGYKAIQDVNGNQAIGGSLVFKPVKGLTTKVYYESHATTGSKAVNNLSLFAGYKGSEWSLGAEYNTLTNGTKYSGPAAGKDLNGVSVYASYDISKKVELFGRYDKLGSNTLTGDLNPWNYSKNGNQIVAGLQYAPVKGVKFALNYQGYSFDNSTLTNQSLMFINAEFKL